MRTDDVSSVQQLQFELIRKVRFNLCDGARVVTDLLDHRSLWHGVVMGRPAYDFKPWPGESEERDLSNLIMLRDIRWDVWNVDTLYVLTSGADDAALEALAQTWLADEVSWIEGVDAQRMLGITKSSASCSSGGIEALGVVDIWVPRRPTTRRRR